MSIMKKTAIFLDIDGVLNCFNTKERIPGTKYIGIDDSRVAILKQIANLSKDTEIILTSTWKDTWEKEGEIPADAKYLNDKLAGYDLVITDKTTDHWDNRGEGIRDYLANHKDIRYFIILDDETFDYKAQHLGRYLIRTSFGLNGGLQEKHVRIAKRILQLQKEKENDLLHG